MKFKIGDKVKFLNEPGGGVVSKIISTSMVNVTIDEGFDIPVLISELVKMHEEDNSGEMFREDFQAKIETAAREEAGNEDENRISQLQRLGSQGISEEGIFIAYHPHNQQWLVTGMLDVYIINNTNTEILFSLFLKSPSKDLFESVDYGSLLPYSKYLVDSIEHDHILEWNTGVVQLIFVPEQSFKILPPVSSDFRIKSSRFANDTLYQASGFLEGRSVLIKLAEKPVPAKPEEEKADHEAPEPIEKKAVKPKEKQLIDQYMTGRDEAVVDLHIGQVIDDLADLSPHDMLKVQLDHFCKCLDNAMANKLRKVTFIHGVGNGTLKEAIIEKMKDYENLEHQSASLAKFGVGAVDILIHNAE
jgi:hypothetical protein